MYLEYAILINILKTIFKASPFRNLFRLFKQNLKLMVPYWYTETSPMNALAKSYTGFALKTEKKCHWIAPSYMLLIHRNYLQIAQYGTTGILY